METLTIYVSTQLGEDLPQGQNTSPMNMPKNRNIKDLIVSLIGLDHQGQVIGPNSLLAFRDNKNIGKDVNLKGSNYLDIARKRRMRLT